jgi:hypothetical protein
VKSQLNIYQIQGTKDPMSKKDHMIPWCTSEDWQAVTRFFHAMSLDLNPALVQIQTLAGQIRQAFEALSDPMDALCNVTCMDCEDICCKRATIWYDFKDLIYFNFTFGRLPEAQIKKVTDKTGSPHCTHFTETGCCLSRLERPFVCTWYLCPAQKQVISSHELNSGHIIPETVDNLKILRNQMESEFCRISAGKPDTK